MIGPNGAEDIADRMRETLRLMPEALVKHRVRLALEIDVRQTIRRLPPPLLIVHGKKDRLLPPWFVRRFLALRSDARVAMIDGSHMILETNPEQVAEALTAFIQDIPLRSGAFPNPPGHA